MVQVKSAGETYTLGTGKQMPWSDVPVWFKEGVRELEDATQKSGDSCKEERERMQQCVLEKGFWHVQCVEALENYDTCQTKTVNSEL